MQAGQIQDTNKPRILLPTQTTEETKPEVKQPDKPQSFWDKLKGAAVSGATNVVKQINPVLGSVLQTKTGQQVAVGTVKSGMTGLKESEKPFLQPFASTANVNFSETPLTPAVKAQPSAGEAAGEALNAGLTAFGLKEAKPAVALAKKLLPEEKSVAEKALTLSSDELKNVNTKKLKWLSEDALSEGKIIGGKIKSTAYAIPKKIKTLSTEFGDILKGTPEEIRGKAETLGKGLYQKTLELFKDNEQALNKNQLLSKMKNAIINDANTVYSSEYEAQQTAEKALNKFSQFVKKGTNKGLEEARQAWYAEAKNASGKLSDANEVIHNIIKKTIKETLPEEKQAIYDAYKQTMAKTYDIEEIMKAKTKTAVRQGKSVLKTVGKVAGTVAAGYGLLKGAEKIGL